MRRGLLAGGLLTAATLCGCAGAQFGGGQASSSAANMDGRWILAAPNAPSCGIEFSGGPGAGKLNPEGGCPAHFFTGRTWTLDGATLTIKDDQDAPLAQLQFVDGRFNGQSSAGVPVMLTPTPMP